MYSFTKHLFSPDDLLNSSNKILIILYTDFYSGFNFIKRMKVLVKQPLKMISHEHCTSVYIPYNESTAKEYECLEVVNKKNWNKSLAL